MKLAEALILRADSQKRFEQLKQRIVRIAKVQEGDEPPEKPKKLIVELEQVSDELVDLIKRINRTNSHAVYQDNKTLSDALAERDLLALRRGVYADLALAASVTHDRYSKSEVKFKSTVNVPEIQKQADEIAKAYREMDSRIQELNWKTELMD